LEKQQLQALGFSGEVKLIRQPTDPWKHSALKTQLDIPLSGGQVYVIGRLGIEKGNPV